jgi:hypothetical protein
MRSEINKTFITFVGVILLILCITIYIEVNTPQYCNPRLNPRPLNTYTWNECYEWFSSNCQMNLTSQYCAKDTDSPTNTIGDKNGK